MCIHTYTKWLASMTSEYAENKQEFWLNFHPYHHQHHHQQPSAHSTRQKKLARLAPTQRIRGTPKKNRSLIIIIYVPSLHWWKVFSHRAACAAWTHSMWRNHIWSQLKYITRVQFSLRYVCAHCMPLEIDEAQTGILSSSECLVWGFS